MTRLYEVDPANVANIYDTDANGRRYGTGGSGPWLTRTGNKPSNLGAAGAPAWDVYPATEDNSPIPQYYVLDRVDLTFSGSVGSQAARVVETRVFAQLSLDDLYAVKLGELRAQDNAVRYSSADTVLAQNWWIIVTQNARNEINGIGINWNLRQHKGENWPGGINAPRIGIFNEVTGQSRREKIDTPGPFETIVEEVSVHERDCSLATDDCGNAMEAEYNQSDWSGLAAIDPSDGSWGYPPYRALSEEALALYNGG